MRSFECAFVPTSDQFYSVLSMLIFTSFLRAAARIQKSLIDQNMIFPEPVRLQMPRAALLSGIVMNQDRPVFGRQSYVLEA